MSTELCQYAWILKANIEQIQDSLGFRTQKELAEYLDVNESTISAWVNLQRSPSIENLLKVAEKTGWSIDRLVGHVPAGMAVLEPVLAQVSATATALNTLLPDRALLDRARKEVAEAAAKAKDGQDKSAEGEEKTGKEA